MATEPILAGNPRISGRRGQPTNLDVDFYHNGVLADPFAIRRVEIYSDQVLPHNLIQTINIVNPYDPTYPSPVIKGDNDADDDDIGSYSLQWQAPLTTDVPNVFNDVWYYFDVDPCTNGTGGTECDLDDPAFAPLLLTTCHRFWLYPNNWFTDDRLQSVSFGFEPLNQKFNTPEKRYLEVGLMPLPLYDFDYNLVMPMIPYLKASVTLTTRHNEKLIIDAPMSIGIRQGSYRTNPFVLRWLLDTTVFLIGTYRYKVTVTLPNGVSQTSPWFILVVN